MHVDYLVKVWRRMRIEDGTDPQMVIEALKEDAAGFANNCGEIDGVETSMSDEILVETESYLSPEENGGTSTFELYDGVNVAPIWQNGQPILNA